MPDLFVPWDSKTKGYYIKYLTGNRAYVEFLKKMQHIAPSLDDENKDIERYLSKESLNKFIEGNKSNYNKANSKDLTKLEEIIKFLKEKGKTLPKFIDEYNWITITKKLKIPPEWHPLIEK